jgi:mono/diheme cytochrome c family protein
VRHHAPVHGVLVRLASALVLVPGLVACGSDTTGITSLTGDAAAGRTLYVSNCQSCHGSAGTARANATGEARSNAAGAAAAVLDGEDEMPGFKDKLGGQQVADILAYLRTL